MRKTAKWLGSALVLLSLLHGLCWAGEAAPQVNSLARWIPADSLLFVAFDGDNAAAKQTALHDIVNDPEVKALLDGPLAALRKIIAQEAMKKGQLDPDVWMPLVGTRIGLAFVGLQMPAAEGGEPRPELLLVIEVGKPDSTAAKAVNLLVEHVKNKIGLAPDAFKAEKIAGVDAQAAKLRGTRIAYATTGGFFVLGTGDAVAKALDANVTKLAAMKEFQRVASVTGGSEILLVYWAHAAALQKFGLLLPPEAGKILVNPEFGLANVRSASLFFAPEGRGFRAGLFIHAPGERKGLLKVLAGRPLAPALLKLAPKNAGMLCASSLDGAALWDFIVAQTADTLEKKREYDAKMAEAQKRLGFDLRKDLVDSLGDEFAVFGPPFAAAVKLKDPDKFKLCVGAGLTRVAAALGANNDLRGAMLGLATMTYKDRVITYVDGRRVPLVIQPCYTMVGDYAVFALHPVSLKTYINDMAAGGSIADNADFAATRAKVGDGASWLYYADTAGFVRELYGIAPLFVGFLKMAPEEHQALCPDPARIPPCETVAKHLFGSMAACRPLEDGVVWESYSPFGLPTPPTLGQGGGAGVGTMAVLAGMLLPAVNRAQEAARKVQCMSNLRQLGIGTMMWRNKFGDAAYFPPSLKALAESEIIAGPKVFLNPASGTRAEPGKFVTDFESTLDKAGFKIKEDTAPAALPLAWDKKAVFGGGRCVLFFDCHVEFVAEERFRELMKQVDDWIAKNRPKQP